MAAGQAKRPAAGFRGSDNTMLDKARERLIDALLELPSLQYLQERNDVISRLPSEIRDAVPYRDKKHSHIRAILQTCEKHKNGLDEFFQILKADEKGSLPFQEACEALEEYRAQQRNGLYAGYRPRQSGLHGDESDFNKILEEIAKIIRRYYGDYGINPDEIFRHTVLEVNRDGERIILEIPAGRIHELNCDRDKKINSFLAHFLTPRPSNRRIYLYCSQNQNSSRSASSRDPCWNCKNNRKNQFISAMLGTTTPTAQFCIPMIFPMQKLSHIAKTGSTPAPSTC